MHDTLDLKTLRAIHVLCQSGSVSKTAQVLKVTPSAISYLIRKARVATGVPLFIRTRRGMTPDNNAKALSDRYQIIRNGLQDSPPTSQDMARPVVISALPLTELLISLAATDRPDDVPPLVFQPPPDNDHDRIIRLRNQETDIDIGTSLPADHSVMQLRCRLGSSGILARHAHATVKDRVTLRDWQENPHAFLNHGIRYLHEDAAFMERFSALTGHDTLPFTASTCLSLVALCTLSDILLLIPERMGKKLCARLPLNWLAAPDALTLHGECYIHYHRTLSGNARLRQTMALVRRALGQQHQGPATASAPR